MSHGHRPVTADTRDVRSERRSGAGCASPGPKPTFLLWRDFVFSASAVRKPFALVLCLRLDAWRT